MSTHNLTSKSEMHVIKRDGTSEPLNFEKIHWRIKSLCSIPQIVDFQRRERPETYETNSKLPYLEHASFDQITLKTIQGLYDGVATTEIDLLSSEIAQGMVTLHPDNSVLAKRILVSNIQKNTLEILVKRFYDIPREVIRSKIFYYTMEALYHNRNKLGEQSPLVAPYVLAVARKNATTLESHIDYTRDFTNHDYLGIKILEKGYLLRCHSIDGLEGKGHILERPSVAAMRIALGLHCAPTPHKNWYQKEDVRQTLVLQPNCIKSKHRDEKSIDVIMATDQPHKHSWLDPVKFSEAYWSYMVYKETGELYPDKFQDILETYDMMTTGLYTPATPSRFNLGTLKPQGSSCFLIGMQDDSLTGIYNTLQVQSQISKYAGGVGMWVSNIRSAGSYISGTNGASNGVAPMLGLFNSSAKYVDQGGGKRPGTIAVYIEPWHADILSFLELKRKQGVDTFRARSLFYGLWIPDEFWRSLRYSKHWYLFDPVVAPKLYDCYDQGFSKDWLSDEFLKEHKEEYLFTYRYRKYIRQGRWEKKISPKYLIDEIVKTVKDSGIPYMMCKDACNRKSNQKNLGTIKSSNLCTEIVEFSGKRSSGEDETAVCNLSSIAVNRFIKDISVDDYNSDNHKNGYHMIYNTGLDSEIKSYKTFDFEAFAHCVKRVVKNLNRIIDVNFYPTSCTKRSNFRHRPMGIGIQGEADMMAMLRLSWNSEEANILRFYIFEQLYYTCLETSVELAAQYGPYETFGGSPADNGLLAHDLWLAEDRRLPYTLSLDWQELKKKIFTTGLRNSLFIAPMPTASTSGILGNSPCIEPFNSLVYNRKLGAGDITLMNKYLVQDLLELDLWNREMSDRILNNRGSIQDSQHYTFPEIPAKLKAIYTTVYDLSYKDIIKAASIRGIFVDQSQSMNLFVDNVTVKTMTQAWSMGWSKGLKTLSYYIRTLPSIEGQKITTDKVIESKNVTDKEDEISGPVCSRDNPDCLACGS